MPTMSANEETEILDAVAAATEEHNSDRHDRNDGDMEQKHMSKPVNHPHRSDRHGHEHEQQPQHYSSFDEKYHAMSTVLDEANALFREPLIDFDATDSASMIDAIKQMHGTQRRQSQIILPVLSVVNDLLVAVKQLTLDDANKPVHEQKVKCTQSTNEDESTTTTDERRSSRKSYGRTVLGCLKAEEEDVETECNDLLDSSARARLQGNKTTQEEDGPSSPDSNSSREEIDKVRSRKPLLPIGQGKVDNVTFRTRKHTPSPFPLDEGYCVDISPSVRIPRAGATAARFNEENVHPNHATDDVSAKMEEARQAKKLSASPDNAKASLLEMPNRKTSYSGFSSSSNLFSNLAAGTTGEGHKRSFSQRVEKTKESGVGKSSLAAPKEKKSEGTELLLESTPCMASPSTLLQVPPIHSSNESIQSKSSQEVMQTAFPIQKLTNVEIFNATSSMSNFKYLLKELNHWSERIKGKVDTMTMSDYNGCQAAVPRNWPYIRRVYFVRFGLHNGCQIPVPHSWPCGRWDDFIKWTTLIGFKRAEPFQLLTVVKCGEKEGLEILDRLKVIWEDHRCGRLKEGTEGNEENAVVASVPE